MEDQKASRNGQAQGSFYFGERSDGAAFGVLGKTLYYAKEQLSREQIRK